MSEAKVKKDELVSVSMLLRSMMLEIPEIESVLIRKDPTTFFHAAEVELTEEQFFDLFIPEECEVFHGEYLDVYSVSYKDAKFKTYAEHKEEE